MTRTNVKLLIVGVGGQGVLTAARILGDAALGAGLDVRIGQLHGMSQRGGSVESSVLFGPGQGAFIETRGAHVLLAFEPLEALRALPRLSADTSAIVNRGRIVPFPLSMQGLPYPEVDGITSKIREITPHVLEVDGTDLLGEADPRSLNIAMLGVLAGLDVLPLEPGAIWTAVARRCSPRALPSNRQAFELGRQAGSGADARPARLTNRAAVSD